jgi:hypothetical protein
MNYCTVRAPKVPHGTRYFQIDLLGDDLMNYLKKSPVVLKFIPSTWVRPLELEHNGLAWSTIHHPQLTESIQFHPGSWSRFAT